MELQRTAEQWRGCDPRAMARMSEAAVMHALQDAKSDVLRMHAETEKLRTLIADIKAWDVAQYMTLPLALRERIQAVVTPNAELRGRPLADGPA